MGLGAMFVLLVASLAASFAWTRISARTAEREVKQWRERANLGLHGGLDGAVGPGIQGGTLLRSANAFDAMPCVVSRERWTPRRTRGRG